MRGARREAVWLSCPWLTHARVAAVAAVARPTAAASFKKLLNTLGNLNVSKRTLYSTNRRAQWHKNLGIAYVNTNDWAVGQSHLMEALRLLEFPGPLTRKELQTALVKQMRKQQKYWSRRSEEYGLRCMRRVQEGGALLTLHRHLPCSARTGSRPSEVKDVREIPRIRTICEILGALHDALLYTTQTDMVRASAGADASEALSKGADVVVLF